MAWCDTTCVPRTLIPNIRSNRLAGVAATPGQVNGACIVDQHVQTAEGLDGPPDAVRHLLLGPDVERDGKGFPSRLLHLFGRRMDRARQFRVRVLGLARSPRHWLRRART